MSVYVDVTITAKVSARVKLEKGETIEQLKERYVDIYLHSAGENGHVEKQDLGAESWDIEVEKVHIDNEMEVN
jgi:soluble P-type ATPase